MPHSNANHLKPVELPLESWLVAVAPEDIRVLTLDELDAAYQAEEISERTLVWTHGMREWLPLHVAAGEEHSEPNAAANTVEAAPMSTAPVAFDLDDALDEAEPPFARKRRSKWGIAVAALVLLGGVGLTLENLGGAKDGDSQLTAAAPAATTASPRRADDDPDAPLELSEGGYKLTAAEERALKQEAEKERRLREKMEAALTGKASKARRAKSRRRPPTKAKPRSKAKTGANSYDPLNGELP